MTIIVKTENPHDAICIELVRELSAELGPLYGTDGTALFTPDDVTIPRAAFVVAWLARQSYSRVPRFRRACAHRLNDR